MEHGFALWDGSSSGRFGHYTMGGLVHAPVLVLGQSEVSLDPHLDSGDMES